jgi:hypothetical protein
MKKLKHDASSLVREKPVANANRKKRAAWLIMVRPLSMILAALREIFDEAAYERFLTRSQRTSSRSAYRAFARENEDSSARRPKCC